MFHKAIFIQVSVNLKDRDEALAWASSVASDDQMWNELLQYDSPFDIVYGVISREIKETLHNFTYWGK